MTNLFNHAYPYLDEHELNLDWLIAKMKELNIKFDEFKVVNNITFSGQWDITKQYPAWTIVSDNNIGYVSIQPVPVGVVLTNTDYWVEVIDYTAQIAGLQQRVVDLENDMITVHADINTINGQIAEINKPRRLLIIGDSYTSNDAWSQYLNGIDSYWVLDDTYFYRAGGGTGFATSTSWEDLTDDSVNTVQGAGHDVDEITDILYIGGVNDGANSASTILTAGNACIAKAKLLYPKAKRIFIAMVGCLTSGVARYNIQRDVIRGYKFIANNNADVYYLENAPFVIHSGIYIQNDGIHPTTSGMQRIASYIYQSVILGNDVMPDYFESISINALTGGSAGGNTYVSMSDKNLELFFSGVTINLPSATSWTYNTNLKIGTLSTRASALLPTKVSDTLFTDVIPVQAMFNGTTEIPCNLNIVEESDNTFGVYLWQGYPYYTAISVTHLKIQEFKHILSY